MECDEIHGEENVAAAQVDDFTVQTSLEDLEFGFSVMKSKQKVQEGMQNCSVVVLMVLQTLVRGIFLSWLCPL